METVDISWKTKAKYFGGRIDDKLTINEHAQEIKKESEAESTYCWDLVVD